MKQAACALAFAVLLAAPLAAAESPPAALDAAPDAGGPPAVATLNALDKITGRVSHLKATIGVPVQFGSLEVTVRSCQSAPPEEAPETKAFLEIRDVKASHDVKAKHGDNLLFSGWMFASSPALNALEHPVYDVWVIACSAVAPSSHAEPAVPAGPAATPGDDGPPADDAPADNAENVPGD